MSTDALYTVRARQKAAVAPQRALERCAAGVRAEAEAFFAACAGSTCPSRRCAS